MGASLFAAPRLALDRVRDESSNQTFRKKSLKKIQNFGAKVVLVDLRDKKLDFIFSSADEIGKELARRLKIARLALGLTQPELASRAGVSVGTIRNLERDGDCAFGTVIRIAQVLRLENGFDALFKPGIQSISELAQLERARLKVRQRAPRKARQKQDST